MEVREPAHAYSKKHFTIQEYLEMERAAITKHEYYKGEIFAMSGAGARHNIIATNIIVALGTALKGSPCRPYGSDMRVHIPENTLFTYPDVSVYCGDIIPSQEDEDTATAPVVIIEILSPSTRNYDRGEKFLLYRAIPTLRHYLLIDSTSLHAELFTFQSAGNWQLQEYNDPNNIIQLNSIGVSLSLTEVYEATHLL